MIDNPVLSMAVLLVMSLSSFALIAHWLANRAIAGLGGLAFGLFSSSVGTGVVLFSDFSKPEYLTLVGYICILSGHMWQWMGFADFWQARTKLLAFTAKALVFIGVLGVVYLKYTGAAWYYKTALSAAIVGCLVCGCSYTILKALGGGLGMYKGVIRRTSVGAAMAAVLFLFHGMYALYHAAVRTGKLAAIDFGILPSLHVMFHFEVIIFSIMVSFVVIIMTAERLQAELKIQEMLDPLTKALNKRAFVEVVKAVLARARRNAEPVSLIMMDIDRFKQINTQHGRAVGDEALCEFAAIVTDGRRAQDVFCRFGGEEFAFLLPGTPEEGADLVAKRIKDKIERSALTPNGIPVKLSISMGVVTERGDDLDADGMLDVVDRRMHHAQKLSFEKITSA